MSEQKPQSSEPMPPSRSSPVRGMFGYLGQMARDAVAGTVGRLLEAPPEPAEMARPGSPTEAGQGGEPEVVQRRRLNVLHGVAEQLRETADTYIAAKLDEIEARVDAKLDGIERRIDQKIVDLHEQLEVMRDRELRHRLRLLKITLVFTVIVALLSLAYRWIIRHWIS